MNMVISVPAIETLRKERNRRWAEGIRRLKNKTVELQASLPGEVEQLRQKVEQLREIRKQDAAVIAELIADKASLQARIDLLEAGR